MPSSATARISKVGRLLIGAGALVVVTVTVGGYFYLKRAPVPPPIKKESVVLADFANTTGDPAIANTLQQALRSELAQWPFLNILSDKTVEETLRLMVRPADQAVDEKTAVEICERNGGKAVLAGSVSRLGGQYLVGLKGINCTTREVMAQATGQAGNMEKVLKSLRDAVSSLRGRIGESLASIQDLQPPRAVTTSSLDAFRAYQQGQIAKSDSAAIPFFKRAIELDPNFAMAYSSLGVRYWNIGENELFGKSIRKAYELRDQVSEWERLAISANYYEGVTGELEKTLQAYEQRTQVQPGNCMPHLNMATIYLKLGNYDKAVTATQEALYLCPENVAALGNLMSMYRMLNRLDDAKATYRQALAKKLDSPNFHANLYWLAFLENDIAGMKRELTWATGTPGTDHGFLAAQASTEAFAGHLEMSRELLARAVDSARRIERAESAALYEVGVALWEAESGNAEQARGNAASALALASTRDVETLAALVMARARDVARAQETADTLNKRFPLDTLIQGYWLPTIRAAVEIGCNHPAQAIALLRRTIPYELGADGSLFPIYVRGQAFLLSGQGKEAAAEFQKILDHPGMVLANPQAVGARIGLARAYALQGETAKARAAYQDFLTLWKDADPDIPLLREAKSEYERLK